MAAATGLPLWLIKTLRRWSSDAYVTYVQPAPALLQAIPHLLTRMQNGHQFIAYHALSIVCCLSCIARCLCSTHCSLYIAYHAPFVIYCLSFIARCLLLITHCSLFLRVLFVAYHQLLTICYFSSTAHYLLLIMVYSHLIDTTYLLPCQALLSNIDQTFKNAISLQQQSLGKLGAVGLLDMKIELLIAISMQHSK